MPLHPEGTDEWDIIVSNPPYIWRKKKGRWRKKRARLRTADSPFVPDEDPLLFYRAIAIYAIDTLRPDGALFSEINLMYAVQMQQMLEGLGSCQTEIKEDQFGKQRFIKSMKR